MGALSSSKVGLSLLAGLVCGCAAARAARAEAPGGPSGSLPVPIAAYATELPAGQPARSANIERAAARLDGACIEPGATFSFDATVGPRRPGDGYLMAPAILDGEKEPAPGGGVCQLSTTLYNAALLAGLTVVERHPHGRPSAYVPPGQDATVARFHKDLKLRNDLGQPLEVDARVVGQKLLVTLRGIEAPAVGYRVERQTLSLDPLLVVTWRVEVRDGREVARQLLGRDAYR